MSRPAPTTRRGTAAAQSAAWLAMSRAATFLGNARRRAPAASVHWAPPPGPASQPAAAAVDPAELAVGAAGVDQLLAVIGGISDDGLAGCAEGDTRDYFAITAAVEDFLESLTAGPPCRKQGALLALGVLLCAEADSRFGADDVPNPLATVARAMQDRAGQRAGLRSGAVDAEGSDASRGRAAP